MLNEDVLKVVLNNKTFGLREAADIVGGRGRLTRLIQASSIRAKKSHPERQNGRWSCNAYDVIKHAKLARG